MASAVEKVTKCSTFNPQALMVMPWQQPSPFKPLNMQDNAAYREHLMDHNANLDLDSPKSPGTLTKIIATIGDASFNEGVFGRMIKHGLSIVRIDMAVGELENHLKLIRRARKAVIEYGAMVQRVTPIAIAVDLRGPEILIGRIADKDKMILKEGDVLNLTTHPAFDERGTQSRLYVGHKELPFVLQPKDKILLDYGRIRLNVRGCYDNEIVCEVLSGGELQSFADVTVLDVPLNIPYVTPKDVKDIQAVTGEDVDILFVSLVTSKKCLETVRKYIGYRGCDIKLIAKIESKAGYHNFDEIIEAADGILINRGKLSIELSSEKVMQAQKSMVARANKIGKPVFAMCEYVNSMVHRNCPTIAEVTDVINTVIEGIDGIVLKEETSHGEFPDLVVRTVSTLSREAEAQVWQQDLWSSLNILSQPPTDPAHAVALAAIEASNKAHASAIVLATTSGTSAKLISSYRPRCPIIAITRYGGVSRRLQLYRGVWPLYYIIAPNPNWIIDVDLRLQFGINCGKLEGLIKPGDPLVLVSGWRQGAGFTNNIRVVYASMDEPWILPYSPVMAP